MEPLMTTADVATLFAVHENTIRRLRLDGELPFVRLDRAIRFRPADVRSFLETHTEGVQHAR